MTNSVLKNFRPVSFLPICSRVFEHIIIWCSYNLQKKTHIQKLISIFIPINYTSVYWPVNGRPVIRLCTIVHYSCTLCPYFTVAIYNFSYCTLFMLHFLILHHFHVPLFCVVILSCCTFFRVALSLWLYFMLQFYTLQCFCFAFFSCCTLRMLQFLLVALCSCCTITRGVARTPTNI